MFGSTQIPRWLIAPFLTGATLALGGGYWDDAWHTERGRDSFFIAPHIAIYTGVSLAGAALGFWAILTLRSQGWRAVLARRPLVLALLGVTVTLASAPIDNAWHLAFGRDAVIWSPPHVLGIVGTAGLATAILVELGEVDRAWAKRLQLLAGALILAAFAFLVVEYQTDVPQFDPVWYLPVLALGSAFAFGLVRQVINQHFAATAVAATYLVFSLVVIAFLWAQGFDRPAVPLLFVPAVVLDITARRRWPVMGQALLYVLALYVAYVPVLDLVGQGVRLGTAQVIVGLPIAWLGVAVVLRALTPGARLLPKHRLATTTLVAVALSALPVSAALAHDPGQGSSAGTLAMRVEVQGKHLAVTLGAPEDQCRGLRPLRLVARRAGKQHQGRLIAHGCRFRGQLAVGEQGRWFVYADLARDGETIESWIPVKVGQDRQVVAPQRFAYIADHKSATTTKWLAGIAIYLMAVGYLVGIAVLVRSHAWPPPAGK